MKLKTFIFLTALAAVAAVAYSVHSQTTPKPLRSFIVTSIMTTPQNGSPYLKTDTKGFAIRSDGSWILITYIPNIAPTDAYIRDIYDVTLGVHTTIDDLSKSLQTRAMTTDEANFKRLSSAASCKGESSGQILGFNVEYIEEKKLVTSNPPATSIVKRWLAPDLGCFALKKETTWTRNSDGVLLVDTKLQPVSIVFQRVDQFFVVPTNYTERTPGETFLELSKLYPNHFSPPQSTAGIDETYVIAHNNLPKH